MVLLIYFERILWCIRGGSDEDLSISISISVGSNTLQELQ